MPPLTERSGGALDLLFWVRIRLGGREYPRGIGYWSHHIDSGQENFTLWEPEEHHDHRCYTDGGSTCGAQVRGL